MRSTTHRSSRRVAAGVCAFALASGALIGGPSASAAERQPAKGDILTEFATLTLGAKLTLNSKTGRAQIVDLKSLAGVVDRAGKALGPLKVNAMKVESGSPLSAATCVKQGKAPKKRFVAFNRTEIFSATSIGNQRYNFYPYMLRKARTVSNVPTTQYEVCGVGGADLKEGWRMHQVGLGMAFPDATRTFKIGESWKAGSTPSDYTVGLGFEAGKEPLSVNGSVSQNPTDKLLGSINGPYPTHIDAFARNGVSAWWQDSCVSGWSKCKFKADGSSEFQGTVAHGLWEFMPADARNVRYFTIAPYLRYGCHGFTCG